MFSKTSPNSQKNTVVRGCFFEFYKILKNTFFTDCLLENACFWTLWSWSWSLKFKNKKLSNRDFISLNHTIFLPKCCIHLTNLQSRLSKSQKVYDFWMLYWNDNLENLSLYSVLLEKLKIISWIFTRPVL